MYKIVLVKTQR